MQTEGEYDETLRPLVGRFWANSRSDANGGGCPVNSRRLCSRGLLRWFIFGLLLFLHCGLCIFVFPVLFCVLGAFGKNFLKLGRASVKDCENRIY